MTNGKRRKTRIVAGLHIVKKPLKQGDRFYVYAWRGGPCIHQTDDRHPVITLDILNLQIAAKKDRYGEAPDSLDAMIKDYKASPAFTNTAPSTQVEYNRWLDRISDRFGNTPIGAFEDRRMRGDIIDWKNNWAEQPRSADAAAVMMSTLLSWGVENARLDVNVAAKIKQLHKPDRSDLIWEDRHWKAMTDAEIPSHLMDALKVASWTGLRLGDLVSLDWSEVGDKAIIRITNKKKSRAVVPILPDMRAWLANQTGKREGAVLRNSRGYPWTKSGLGSVFQKKQPEGFDRSIHDLRGSFCTMLLLKGLTDDQAAMIMGWTAKRVSEIRSRYVNEERVIISLLDRLSA